MGTELALCLTIAAAYLIVLVELVALPIPSEASTYAEWRRRRSRGAGVMAGYAALLVVFGLPLAFVLHPPSFAHIPASAELPAFGQAAIASGAIVTIAGATVLGLVATLQLRRHRARTPTQLKTDGVFAYSRNPIVLSLHLTAIGSLAALPVLPLLIALPIYLLHMHTRIRLEEHQLLERCGAEFEAYRAEVLRYFGRVRLSRSQASAQANRYGAPRS